MRNRIYLGFLVIFFAACKKDKDQAVQPPIIKTDWSTELKNSVWNAEIQYTDGPLLIPQYCSFVFGNDNTLTLNELRVIHPCTWSVIDSAITIDDNGIKRKADLGKVNWKYYENSLSFQYNILSVTKAVAVDPVAIVGTVWKGSFVGNNLQLEFLAGKNIKITHSKVNGGAPYTTTYTNYGSGILFGTPYTGVPIGVSYFGCLYNNEFRGLGFQGGSSFQFYWKVTKQ